MITEETRLLKEAKENLKSYQATIQKYKVDGKVFQQGFKKDGTPETNVDVAMRMIEYYKKQIDELSYFEEIWLQ